MKVLRVHIFCGRVWPDGTIEDNIGPVTADVHIPGIGELTVSNCLAEETIKSIEKQVEKVAQARLGIKGKE